MRLFQSILSCDGNKRTALYLTELLLQRSGDKLDVFDLELFNKFVLVAKEEMDYDGLPLVAEGSYQPSGLNSSAQNMEFSCPKGNCTKLRMV